MRECYSCGSIKTYVRKDGQEHWYRNKPFQQWLCEECNNKLVKNPKWHPITNPITHKRWSALNNKKWNIRRMLFRGKPVFLDSNPKTGYCSLCPNNIFNGTCKRTSIHHLLYHENDPLKDTIEICNSCHFKQHRTKITKLTK